MLRRVNNLSIKSKAFAAYAVLAVCLIGLGGSAFITLQHWAYGLERISHTDLPEQQRLHSLRNRMSDLQLDIFRYVAWANNAVSDGVLDDLRFDIQNDFSLIEHELHALAGQPKGVELRPWSEIVNGWAAFKKAASDALDIARADPPMGTMMLGGADDLFQRFASELEHVSSQIADRVQVSTERLAMEANVDQRLFGLISMAGVLLGLAFTALIARSIAQPIQAVTAAMSRIARGETSGEINHEDRRDEIGQMLRAISTFRDRITRDNRILAEREQQLVIQNMRFDAAINNMSQGLAMFDCHRNLIVCNSQYAEIYRLPPALMRPGTTQREVLEHRVSAGIYAGKDPQKYIVQRVDNAAKGAHSDSILELSDARVLAVSHRVMSDGGWVSTHEDITEHRRAEEERDRNRKFLDLILERVPVPVFVKNVTERRFVLINRAFEEFCGVRREDIIGHTVHDLFSDRDADVIASRDEEVLKSGALNFDEREFQTPGNGVRFASTKLLAIQDDDGNPCYLLGVIDDLTKRRQLERERDQSRAFLNAIVENIPITIFAKELAEHRYILVNKAAEDLWGIPRDQVIGRTAQDIFSQATADIIRAGDQELLKQKNKRSQIMHQIETPKNGSRLVNSRKLTLLDHDGEPQYLIGVIEDVTESARAAERVKFMAHHDLLTGLPNRAMFLEKIEDAIDRQRRHGDSFSVFMLDLDRFKAVNDTLGHAAGDALLRETARRIKSALRDTDVLARLGGDEFAIIQPTAAQQATEASALAQRIIALFAAPFELEEDSVVVGTSIGIALAPKHGNDPHDLIKKADLALYRAKADGRNGHAFFDAQLAAQAEIRHQLERELRAAICDQTLEVHYQPIFDARTLEACAVEALVRWQHAEKGFIPPAEFISLAEETGLIIEVGNQVLQKACREAAGWPRHIKLAVNLSPLQFKRGDLLGSITRALAQSGFSADRLELEITESLLIERYIEVIPLVQQLKKLGISIVLDDFGTGYSSLSYLAMLPFDKIKIEKTFAQNLTNGAECAAIFSAVRTLGNALHMQTIAEGVETEEQLRLVRAAGTNFVQGYLLGGPYSASDLNLTCFTTGTSAEKAA